MGCRARRGRGTSTTSRTTRRIHPKNEVVALNLKMLLGVVVFMPSCAWAQSWDCRTFFGFGDVAVTDY
jgi:hypothetical protein